MGRISSRYFDFMFLVSYYCWNVNVTICMESHVLYFPIWLFFYLCVYMCGFYTYMPLWAYGGQRTTFRSVCVCDVYTHTSLRGYRGQRAGFRSPFSFHHGFQESHSNHQALLPAQPSHHSAIWFVPIFISRQSMYIWFSMSLEFYIHGLNQPQIKTSQGKATLSTRTLYSSCSSWQQCGSDSPVFILCQMWLIGHLEMI